MRDGAGATNRTTLVMAERNPTGGGGGSTGIARDASSFADRDRGDVADLARRLAWSGVSAEVRVIPASSRRIAATLAAAAEECGADLVVMGAYGRPRARELIFGSCTEAVLHHGDRPILLMH
jgi:nucleotide-binding universal stress UspA family protein